MMDEQDFDLDNLDNLLDGFDGVTVEGGVDTDKETMLVPVERVRFKFI